MLERLSVVKYSCGVDQNTHGVEESINLPGSAIEDGEGNHASDFDQNRSVTVTRGKPEEEKKQW